MRIGLDLDGVTVDSPGRWVEIFNREAGTRFSPGTLVNTYGTPEYAQISTNHELEMLIAPPPVPGAREALSVLRAAGHELVVVTARTPRLRQLTEAWFAYYGLPAVRMHFLEGGDKSRVARAERLEAFVEDAPGNALALAAAGIPVLLFDAPYNQDTAHPMVRRCRGWAEVLRALGLPWQEVAV